MAHRPEDVALQAELHATQTGPAAPLPGLIADLEPVAGLIAAATRLCVTLPYEIVAALPDQAGDALATMQSILWRLEHAPVQAAPDGEAPIQAR